MANAAPASRGGTNATTIGMVIAIIVAVALLGVLIWLFTLQEGLRERADRAVLAKKKLVHGADESTARKLFPGATGVSKTLVGEMNNGVKVLLSRLTGNQNETLQTALSSLDNELAEIQSDDRIPQETVGELTRDAGVVKIMDTLYKLYADQRDALAKAQAENEKIDTDLEKTQAADQKVKGNFEEQIAKLQATVEQLQATKQALEDDKNAENAALRRELEAKRDAIDQMRQERAKLKHAFRDMLAKERELSVEQSIALKQLRGAAPLNAQPLALARKPAGRVLRALPGDSLVHIDLGREDNVVLGMTFSVYSANERIPAEGRGKASIEVVSVSRRTSECRVVSPPSPNDPILEGDAVGNIVLNRIRNKKPRFSVIGRFDVDFDGTVDIRGREKIVSVIQRWGGVVVDHVDALTDYVVVGLEPPGEVAPYSTGFGAISGLADETGLSGEKSSADVSEEEDSGDQADQDAVEDDNEDNEDESGFDEGDDTDSGDEEDVDDGDDSEDDDSDNGDDDSADDDGGDDDADGLGFSGDQDLSPSILRKPETDPTRATQKRRFQSERQEYEETLRRAKMLSIPVLTQEQFFNFIGIEGTVSDVRRLQG